MDPNLIINSTAVTRENKIGNIVKEEHKDLFSYYEQLSKVGYFDSGLLPLEGSGLLSIRHAGNRTQFVFQHTPGIYYILWGAHEGSDGPDQQVLLAQPYRIVIGDHVNGTIRGARHFYSPVPITSINQPLYHCNVPNLNCRGYNGTGVGWICIYHRDKTYTDDLPLSAKIHKTVEHASGHEAYNDGNMGSTDGPRFYKDHYGGDPNYKFLYNKLEWQKKTEKEGYEWTTNPDLWIPVRVAGIDDQKGHDPNGEILTLEMAMLGNYAAYYPGKCPDEKELSLMNRIRRADQKIPESKEMFSVFAEVFNKSKKTEEVKAEKKEKIEKLSPAKGKAIKGIKGTLLTDGFQEDGVAWQPEAAPFEAVVQAEQNKTIGYCGYCQVAIKQKDESFKDTAGKFICKNCKEQHFITTNCCNVLAHAGDLFYWEATNEYYCHSCHTQDICVSCGAVYLDSSGVLYDDVCMGCNPEPSWCDSCGAKHSESNVQKVSAKAPSAEHADVFVNKMFTLCIPCFGNSVLCACGFIRNEDACNQLPTGENVCGPCVSFIDQVPTYTPISIKQEV